MSLLNFWWEAGITGKIPKIILYFKCFAGLFFLTLKQKKSGPIGPLLNESILLISIQGFELKPRLSFV